MAELSPSIYQLLNQREVPLDPFGAMQQGQRSALGQMALQEQRRQQQVEEQTRALYRQYYGQGVSGSGSLVAGSQPGTTNQQPGTLQETVNTPYSSDLQNMLAQYQQEGADVTPTPGARTLPAAGPGSGSLVSGSPPGTMNQQPGTPHAGVDRAGLARALYQIDPAAGAAAEKAAVESQKAQLEMVGKQNAMVSQVARSILLADTQQAYETGVQYLTQLGIPTQHLPAMYDRRMVEHYYGMSTDAETRVKEAQSRLYSTQAELEPRQLAFEESREQRIATQQGTQEERLEKQRLETEQHNRAMEKIQRDAAERGWTGEHRQEREAVETARHHRAMESNQAGTAARGVSKEQFDQEDKLRNDFIAQTKPYQTQSDFYGRIQSAAKDPSATGDLAVIYSFMKLLDPGSTVLSGEYATAQNAGSVPERIIGQYNRMINGERLSPEIRKDFVDRSERLYAQATKDYERTKKTFEDRATRYQLNPANVTQDLSSTVTPATAAPAPAQPAAAPGRQRVGRATVDKLAAETKVPRATVIQRLRAAGLDVEE